MPLKWTLLGFESYFDLIDTLVADQYYSFHVFKN